MNPSSPNIPPQRLALFLQALQPLAVDLDEKMVGRLLRYVTRQLDGEPVRAHDPDLALLLDRDPALAEAYAILYDLEEAVRTEALPIRDPIPAPDLSFLFRSSLQQSIAWLERSAGGFFVRFSEELMARQRPIAPVAGLRQADSGRYGARLMVLKGAELANPQPVVITVFADRQQPEVALIEVEVGQPGKSWPELGGVAVELRAGDFHLATETDPWGLAVFEGVPRSILPDVSLYIQQSGQ